MSKFTPDNQPENKRGKAFKTKLFEAMREEALLDLAPGHDADQAEQAFMRHVAKKAFGGGKESNALLKELMNKSYPTLKPTMEPFEFDMPENSTPAQKAEAVMLAVSKGQLPPDVGHMLVTAARATLEIESITDIKERIAALERQYEQQSS